MNPTLADVMVAMPDGIRLATDVYLPQEQPCPAILERTPYNKKRADLVETAGFFARRGYAVVLQDVRGRFGSEGSGYGKVAEASDGHETARWLINQPWSDGRFGTIGISYTAGTQVQLGATGPPGLASQFIAQGFSNQHDGRVREGGAFRLSLLIRQFRLAAQSREARENPALGRHLEEELGRVGQWLRRLPLRRGLSPLSLVPEYEEYLLDVMRRGDYDEFWRGLAFSLEDHYDDYPDVPIAFLGGWYDSHAGPTCQGYAQLSARLQSPVHLIMGPWTHGPDNIGSPVAGGIHLGPEAEMDLNSERGRWFDATLRHPGTPGPGTPPVRAFIMGTGSGRKTPSGHLDHGGYWRVSESWPLAGTRPRALYLRGDGTLSSSPPGDEAPGSTSFEFDPADPVPTIGGSVSSGEPIMFPGGFDQVCSPEIFGSTDSLPLAARRDVLVFMTPPLEEDLEIAGPIEALLHVESNAPDTDITIKLIDVYPPNPDYPAGYALNLADGILRLRYRQSREKPRFLEPGRPCRVTVRTFPTANRFRRGHRIRLDVSSSNFPRYDVNPNTKEPLQRHRRTMVAVNTIHHRPGRASRLLLPVIPTGQIQ